MVIVLLLLCDLERAVSITWNGMQNGTETEWYICYNSPVTHNNVQVSNTYTILHSPMVYPEPTVHLPSYSSSVMQSS